MKVFPDSWELPFWMGYDYYIYFRDYEKAVKYLWLSTQKPNNPKLFTAVLLGVFRKSGNYEKALWAMMNLLEKEKDERIKEIYFNRLLQLKNLALLQNAAMAYKKQFDRYPSDLNDLVTSGLVKKLPEDPFGTPYVWDAKRSIVTLKKKEMPRRRKK
jgi:hypothetical protein